MRNLKRALSLTLASVMLLGMMVVGTSALSFSDADDISNVTAATVLQELGVMSGNNGKFSPKSTVTRGQMAILICQMLYGDKLNVSQFAGISKFDDVPANAYYTGYVNLANSLGIISGYGNGKFGPGAKVTTAQAALMLTKALGYFQAGELEGQSWINNAQAAVAQATKIDMFGSLKLGTNDPLSRDDVCEMVFNAMTKAVPVHYSERWDVYYTDSQSILEGVKFNYRNTLAYQNFDLVYDADEVDDFQRPATEWGLGSIKNGNAGIDDKGNIAKDGANIKVSFIKAINEPDATYTADVKLGDIYKDLGLSKAVDEDSVFFYRNGKDEDETDGDNGKIETRDGTDLDTMGLTKGEEKKIGGKGVLTQVWYDVDDQTATITMIDTYVGKVAGVVKATGAADRYVKLKETSMATYPSDVNDKFETESFDTDDLVYFTIAWNGAAYDIESVATLNKTTTAVLTKWVGGTVVSSSKGDAVSNFTAGNVTYNYSENKRIEDEDGHATTIDTFDVNESEINIYLDKYGYALYVSGVEGETNYAAVIGLGKVNQYGSMTRGATLLLPDGTQKEVTAKADNWNLFTGVKSSTNVGSMSDNDRENLVTDGVADIVTYTVGSDGVYKLTIAGNDRLNGGADNRIYSGQYDVGAIDKNYDGTRNDPDTDDSTTFVNGKSLMQLFTKFDNTTESTGTNSAGATVTYYAAAPAQGTYYTTSKTIFFVATPKTSGTGYNYNVYTGFSEAPSLNTGVDHDRNFINGVAFVTNKQYTNQIDAVYIDAEKVAGTGSDTYIVFNPAEHKITTDSDGKYYILPAIVKGEETKLKVDASAEALWNTVDSDGTSIIQRSTKGRLENAARSVYAISNMIVEKGIITSLDVDNYTTFNLAMGDTTKYYDGTSLVNNTTRIGIGTVKDRNAVLGIGTIISGASVDAQYWAYTKDTKDTKVFTMNKDYTSFQVSNIGNIGTDVDDLVYAVWDNEAKVLVDVIVVDVVNGTTVVTPNPSAGPLDDIYVQEVNNVYEVWTTRSKLDNADITAAILTYIESKGEKVDGIQFEVHSAGTPDGYVTKIVGITTTKTDVNITLNKAVEAVNGAQAAEDMANKINKDKNSKIKATQVQDTITIEVKPGESYSDTELKKDLKEVMSDLYKDGIVTVEYNTEFYDWDATAKDFVKRTASSSSARVAPVLLSDVLAAASKGAGGNNIAVTLISEDKDGNTTERDVTLDLSAVGTAAKVPAATIGAIVYEDTTAGAIHVAGDDSTANPAKGATVTITLADSSVTASGVTVTNNETSTFTVTKGVVTDGKLVLTIAADASATTETTKTFTVAVTAVGDDYADVAATTITVKVAAKPGAATVVDEGTKAKLVATVSYKESDGTTAVASPTWANGDKVVITSTGGSVDLSVTINYDGTDWTATGAPSGYNVTFDGSELTLEATSATTVASTPFGTISAEPTCAATAGMKAEVDNAGATWTAGVAPAT